MIAVLKLNLIFFFVILFRKSQCSDYCEFVDTCRCCECGLYMNLSFRVFYVLVSFGWDYLKLETSALGINILYEGQGIVLSSLSLMECILLLTQTLVV